MDISGENKRKIANTTRIIGPAFLLRAYTQGIFPMSLEDGEIGWFCPDPRGVIPLETFHLPHGLKRFMKKSPFKIKVNTCFRDVIEGCSDRDETWIDDVPETGIHLDFERRFFHEALQAVGQMKRFKRNHAPGI
ncbi:MAG: leucyl/phenylalanyl-tRNA--protein transferase, partial [Verrucomicrobiota bacterium]